MFRLRDGQTIDAATAALRSVQPAVRAATIPQRWGAEDRAAYLTGPFELEPASAGRSELRTQYRRPLLVLDGHGRRRAARRLRQRRQPAARARRGPAARTVGAARPGRVAGPDRASAPDRKRAAGDPGHGARSRAGRLGLAAAGDPARDLGVQRDARAAAGLASARIPGRARRDDRHRLRPGAGVARPARQRVRRCRARHRRPRHAPRDGVRSARGRAGGAVAGPGRRRRSVRPDVHGARRPGPRLPAGGPAAGVARHRTHAGRAAWRGPRPREGCRRAGGGGAGGRRCRRSSPGRNILDGIAGRARRPPGPGHRAIGARQRDHAGLVCDLRRRRSSRAGTSTPATCRAPRWRS